jgi:hypothetical protein
MSSPLFLSLLVYPCFVQDWKEGRKKWKQENITKMKTNQPKKKYIYIFKKCGLNSKYKYYNFILVATHHDGVDRLI